LPVYKVSPHKSNHNHTGHDLPLLPIKTSRPSKNTPQNLEHLREKRKKEKKDTTASLEERHKIYYNFEKGRPLTSVGSPSLSQFVIRLKTV
jgi:hypothetical protein